MSGYINDELIEEIRVNNDIVSVVSEYVKLDRKGKNHFGLCPFHKEKTPSFSVDSLKQIFFCFGCNKGGNVISFIRLIENLDFPEALKYLAERAGISLPEGDNGDEIEKARIRKELLGFNKAAARFYYEYLISKEGVKGKQYFTGRGITDNTIRRFGLGFSPESGNSLCKFVEAKGYNSDLAVKSGLVSIDRNNGFRDRFKSRVMFPIFDLRGNIIGFGGRIIEADPTAPKYVNTPETLVYSKSKSLYALNLAKNAGSKILLVVEGYMDVISLHQNGIINTVASLGTAMTEGQAKLLKKYAEEVVISYDSDAAGEAAAMRSLDILDEMGCAVKVMAVPEGKDPDEFIRKKGPAAFRKVMESAQPLVEYKTAVLKRQIDTDSTEGKIKFISKLADILSKLDSPVETEMYARKIARDYGISEDAVFNEISRRMKPGTGKRAVKAQDRQDKLARQENQAMVAAKDPEAYGRLLYFEMMLISVLCTDNTAYGVVKGKISEHDFTGESNRKIAEIIFKRLDNNIGIVPAELFSMLDADEAGTYAKIIEKECRYDDYAKAASDIAAKIRSEHIERRHAELIMMLGGKEELTPDDRKRLMGELDVVLHEKRRK